MIARSQLNEILAPLRAAVAVVTDTDAVLAASSFAKACGLVRGSTLGPPDVLDLVTLSRQTGRPVDHDHDLRLAPGPSSPAVQLAIKAVPLSNGAVLVLGEDHSADLRNLLEEGHLAGATLDVFEDEPLPPDHWLWTQPFVNVTPHISAQTVRRDAVVQVALAVRALMRGALPAGVVKRSRGY